MSQSNFFELVYQITDLIPKGRVATYGDIAEAIGSKGGAQMVGWALNALNKSGNPKKIPAHRVVNRNGLLTGKRNFGEPTAMQQMLEKEGIKIIENRIQNFEKLKWIPINEINI